MPVEYATDSACIVEQLDIVDDLAHFAMSELHSNLKGNSRCNRTRQGEEREVSGGEQRRRRTRDSGAVLRSVARRT